MVAFMVLLIQSSIGSAICGCPTQATRTVQAKVMPTCHMLAKSCCACCRPSSTGPAIQTKSCSTNCGITASWVGETPTLPGFVPQVVCAILPEPLPVVDRFQAGSAVPVSRHLTVPRIRPPNARQHGLRAPPAR
jgi:hypothetical protein